MAGTGDGPEPPTSTGTMMLIRRLGRPWTRFHCSTVRKQAASRMSFDRHLQRLRPGADPSQLRPGQGPLAEGYPGDGFDVARQILALGTSGATRKRWARPAVILR